MLYIILLVFRSKSRSVQLPHSYHRLILRVFLLFYSYRNDFVYESCNDRATKTPSPPPHLPPVPTIYGCIIFFFAVSLLKESGDDGKGPGGLRILYIRHQTAALRMSRSSSHTCEYICIYYAHTRISSHVFAWALKRGSQCSHNARYTYSIYLYVYIPTIPMNKTDGVEPVI